MSSTIKKLSRVQKYDRIKERLGYVMENKDIEEYSRLLKECEKANQEAQKLQTEITLLKEQGVEKLKENGYTSLADTNRIDEEIVKIEEEIKEEIPKMKAYIEEVNQKKELKERIMMG